MRSDDKIFEVLLSYIFPDGPRHFVKYAIVTNDERKAMLVAKKRFRSTHPGVEPEERNVVPLTIGTDGFLYSSE